jgi:hypothetical protein
MTDERDETRQIDQNSIWAGLHESVSAPDIEERLERWNELAAEVVKPLKDAEQLSAEDFQVMINAR